MLWYAAALFAGWNRSKDGAAFVVIVTLALQLALGIPLAIENQRLLGLPSPSYGALAVFAVFKILVLVGIFYLVGRGARSLWERRDRAATAAPSERNSGRHFVPLL